MATFLVCHGAWSGGWSWGRLRRPLRAVGHDIFAPTYTGLGERAHLAHPGIGLDTHAEDILKVMEYEGLSEVVLVGHSYGGMVATVVADRAADRISRLIYVDAFVPEDGMSVLDHQEPAVRARMRALAAAEGDGWRIPPGPLAADVSEADAAWIVPRRVPQPLRTFEDPARLAGGGAGLPRAYLYCRVKAGDDPFAAVAARVRNEPGWLYTELDSGHVPNITMPDALAGYFHRIVTGGG
jgi:pimeloyl-ACP methyl ester carboxylesterase